MDELPKDKSKMLTLLPICDVDKKTHIHIHSSSSSKKISDLEKINSWKLYLKYCPSEMKYSLLQDSQRGAGYAVILTKFNTTVMDECVKFSSLSPKQINLAGIDVFWSVTSIGHLQLDFYVNTNELVDNIEDSIKALNRMCQNHVAPVINKFLLYRKQPLTMDAEFYESHNFSKSSHHFQCFFDELEKWTKRWTISENYEVREDFLNFQLMEYQKNTVKWMIERELRPEWIDLSRFLKSVQLVTPANANNNQSLYYFPAFGLFTKSNIFQKILAPKGGILADEMGLGKTVEILSLIVSHRKDEEVRIVQNKPTTSQPKNSNSTQKHLNWSEYKASKSGNRLGRSAVVYTVTPEEWKNKNPGSCRKCENCNDMCDLEKSGWKVEFEKEKEEFWCPRCMATKAPLEVKTTLIVLPESLIVQWYNEISKHCSEDLKVMFYFGLNKNGYLHPLEIAKFDIILTTYSTLTNEMPFTDFQNGSQPRLTRIRKFSPTSIIHVKWWRLIGDESQLVEGSTSRAAQMCTRIESQYRWCMTGTPIVKSISDLGGLFRIVGLWPFNVEHFWKNNVVAEFHDMADQNKDLLNSSLLQITGQVMRRNTKKMVEDELKIPKLVQIEKVVQFTKIEESQYKKEMEGVRKLVEDAIGNQEDEKSLNSMSGKEKVLQSLGKLKETLISCGEHANFSKRKNANEEVISDPKNVIFRLIRAKKTEINDYLRQTIFPLLRVAEIYWLRKEMVETANRYDKVADVILLMEDLNKYFNQVMKIDEMKLSDEERDSSAEENLKIEISEQPDRNDSKSLEQTSNRKRSHEKENEKPQKVAKLECQEEKEEDKVRLEAEQKAKKSMFEMRNNAMRPIRMDCLLMIRFSINIGKEFDCPEADEKRKAIIEKVGGHGSMMRETEKAIEEYWKIEHNNLIDVKIKQQEIFDEWMQKNDQHDGMKNTLLAFENSYLATKSSFLIEKILSLEKTVPLLKEMSFWPIFRNSEQRFKDGEQPYIPPGHYGYERVKNHNYARCMGICNEEKFWRIVENYTKSTSAEVLREMIKFIEKVEELKKELLNDYSELLNDFPHSSPLDCLKSTDLDTLVCEHKMRDNAKMCIDEASRNAEKAKKNCRICSITHTLAHLRFLIGTGSYHGQAKKETRKTIDLFFSMVFSIERRKDVRFDGTKQLSDFVKYIERIRQTTIHIQSSCDLIIEYNKKVKELYSAQIRISVEKLKLIHKKSENWSADKLTAHFAPYFERHYNHKRKKLETACQELRYLANLYKKEQNEVSNTIKEENDDDENCCPICFLKLEVVMHLPCGHKTCERCYQELRNRSKSTGQLMHCTTCRKSFKDEEVIEGRRNVVATMNREQNVIPGMTLAVKLETTIRLMKDIIEKDPENNKILLFTTLDCGKPIWRFLTKVLEKAKMPFVEVTRQDYGKRVSDFEFSPESKILLCSLSMCANGLNLTQANHIIFLDPTHLFSVVEQAIGRINRYSQKKEMKVYHMIVEGSIDEELRKIVKTARNGEEQQKEGKELTVGELRQIFGILE